MAYRRELAVLFDNSFEGFLCILFAYYYEDILPLNIQADQSYQLTLDAEEYYIATDYDKAMRVEKGIKRKISRQAFDNLYSAFLTENEDIYMDMFRYAVLGFRVGEAVDSHLQEDCVLAVHKNARYVGRETHLLTGFCRFKETDEHVFYCEISPVNNVLHLLAEHFSERMSNQAWVIHDKKRGIAAIFDGSKYIIGAVPTNVKLQYSDKEEAIQDLWKSFFDTLAIKERRNKKLQRNFVPLYFRKWMLEIQSI